MLHSNVLGVGVASRLLLMCLTSLLSVTAESCSDDLGFEDKYGYDCMDWTGYEPCTDAQGKDGFETAGGPSVTYSAEDMKNVRKNCPFTCNSCTKSDREGINYLNVVLVLICVASCLAFCVYRACKSCFIRVQQDKYTAKVWEHFRGKGSPPSSAAPASQVQKVVGYVRPLQDYQDEQLTQVTSAVAAASSGTTMQVTVPPNAAHGTFIQVQGPNGGSLISTQVSPDAVPSTQIQVPIPAAAPISAANAKSPKKTSLSPFGQHECLFYQVKIEEYLDNSNYKGWKDIRLVKEGALFALADANAPGPGDGRVVVRIADLDADNFEQGALVAGPVHSCEGTTMGMGGQPPSPELAALLQAYNIPLKEGFLVKNTRHLRATEKYLPIGHRLAVVGVVKAATAMQSSVEFAGLTKRITPVMGLANNPASIYGNPEVGAWLRKAARKHMLVSSADADTGFTVELGQRVRPNQIVPAAPIPIITATPVS